MKIRKNLVIPFAAIIILGLYLVFNTTGKMNYKIPRFKAIEPQTIDKIEITNNKGTINLYSDNGVWRFNPDNYRAEPSKIESMLTFLENPQFADMVSDTNNYQNYGLEDKKYIHIKAGIKGNSSEKPDREFFIGDLNQSKKFAFIRTPDNKAVFTVRANIQKIFDINENDLLNKQILRIDSSNIDKIEIISGDKKTTLNKTVDSDSKDVWRNESGKDANTDAVGQSLRYLSNSRFESYLAANAVNNKDLFTLNLYEEDTIHSFTILKKNEKNYFAKSGYAEKEFLLSENTGTQIIKMFTDILNNI